MEQDKREWINVILVSMHAGMAFKPLKGVYRNSYHSRKGERGKREGKEKKYFIVKINNII